MDIYQVIDNIYNISNDSEENKGFVENGLNNPLSLSEVKSFYESIIVLDNIKENNPRYVEFTANNSGNPFIMESSMPNNEENHDGQHPVLLSDTGSGDEPKVEQETTSLNSLNSDAELI